MSNRRSFLKQSAAGSLALATPYIWTSSRVHAQDANSKPTIAAIGVGGPRGRFNRGGNIARRAALMGQMIAVCDVDDQHTQDFNADFDNKLSAYRDYRELLEKERPDVVTIGTPDHWHVPISIAALRAGCDVYCEKPLTLTIQEGIDICKVVEETGKVFQVGTQQRSENAQRFLKAVAIVQSGRLGKNVNAYVAIGGAPGDGPFDATPAPKDIDWDMWVGPAPKADYSEQRRRMFRWWFEYSGGKMTDWGAHHIDIALWALGDESDGPIQVSGQGKFPPIVPDDFNWSAFLDGKEQLPNGFNTATNFSIEVKLPSGSTISVNDRYRRNDGTRFGNGILFEGDAGRIFVNRGKLEGKPIEEMTEADHNEIDQRVRDLYHGKKSGDHMRNFFECLVTREDPISDVYSHHDTMTLCHLCNISLMLGRDVTWNPAEERFDGDDQADALVSRASREGYGIDANA